MATSIAPSPTKAPTVTATAPLAVRAKTWLRRRWGYAAVAAALLVGVVFALMMVSRTVYVPVARDMMPEEQQAAVTALEAKNIPYKLTANGITVPQEQRYEARMELAVNGAPVGRTPGFELFDNNTMGRSTFSQKVNFRRALEGEMARTIQALAPVERARVHLVMPERRLFGRDQASPTASVIVTVKRSRMLSKLQINSIRQLVSGAVERLLPNQVAVIDHLGQTLARADGESMDGSDRIMEKTRTYEQALEASIVALLEPTIGRGRVRAKVAAQLDFSKLSEHEETYDPESQTVRSEREKLEKTEGAARPARGAPGTASNLPTRRAARQKIPFTKPSKADRSDSTKNYVMDRKVTKRQTHSPRVQRLSVAVIIDGVRGVNGALERVHSRQEIAAYTKLLTTAVGLDVSRGDTIDVASMEFSQDPSLGLSSETEDDKQDQQTLGDFIAYGGAALGLLLMLVVIFLVLRARRVPQLEESTVDADQLKLVDGREGEKEDGATAEVVELGLQAEIALLRDRARKQSENDLLVTASVIRTWLHADTAS